MPAPIFLPERLPAGKATETGRPSWAHEHAANDSFPAQHPLPGLPYRQAATAAPRLAAAILASLMLHLGLAILVSSALTYTAVKEAASPPLRVTLAQAPMHAVPATGTPARATASDLPGEPQIQRETVGPSQQPARFLVDPDLSVLEEIPTTFPGTISLRLNVTSQGRVERVSVVRADPVPKELIDGLIDRFGKAKLSPAMMGSQAIASSIEVTIRVDPPAQFFDPAR